MALESMLEALNAARTKYEKEMREAGEKAIADVIVPLVPEGFRVTWTQYTPYFNDGEPCVFSVGSLELIRISDDREIYTEEERRKALGDAYPAWTELEKAWYKLPRDMFEAAFGDHRQITVENGKLTHEEFDHE